jgi:hypothetical protein
MGSYTQADFKEAEYLLPWYVTGQVSDEERAFVDRILEDSFLLQQEFVEQKQLSEVIQQDVNVVDLSVLDSTGQRLQGLLKRIDQESQYEAIGESTGFGFSGISGLVQKARKVIVPFWEGRPNNFVYAVLASLVVFQFVMFVWLVSSSPNEEVEYVVATPGGIEQSTNSELLIEFSPRASKEDIKQILSEIKGFVAETPAGSYLYRIVLERKLSESEFTAFIESLKNKNELIIFAGKGY